MSTISIDSVSRWYGNVVAVNGISMTVGPGVTGLLGPNGAGKTTLIALMAGFLAPSAGSVTLDGTAIWRHTDAYKTIGLVPEREVSFGYLTGRQFVLANAELHGLADPGAAAQRALEIVEMVEPAERRIGTYSKGMRQRAKLASALVHDPAVLLLDEPFNGVDPRQRLHLMALLRQMGAEGRTVLFSSHILEEVEQVARQIEVVVSGRHAASGDFGQIRRLMTDRPVQYVVVSDGDRTLASALIAEPSVVAVSLRSAGRRRRLGLRLRRLRRPAPAAGARPRRPDPRARPDRRVAGERLRLPGGGMTMNSTIARLSAQALFGRRRGVVLVLIPGILVALAIIVRALTEEGVGYEAMVNLGFTLALPIVALLASAAVLGPEVDDGSIVYLLAKPVSRHTVAFSKYVVAWAATMALGAFPLMVSGLIIDTSDPRQAVGWLVAGIVAGTTYTALFLGLAALTRHAVVAGLLFVLLWEGLLGNLFTGIRWVAIGAWGHDAGPRRERRPRRPPTPA